MKKIIELKIEETKAVVGGIRVVVAPPGAASPARQLRRPERDSFL
jgi:hypothetical protein